MVKMLQKTVWRFLKILTIELLCNLAILLLGRSPEELKRVPQRYICTSMFIAALFTMVKMWRQCKLIHFFPIKIMWFIHTIEYYLTFKKKECYKMNEIQVHCVKWTKPITKKANTA